MFRRFIKPSKSSLNLSSSALKCFVISTPLFLRYSDAEGRFIIPLSSNSVLKVMFTSLQVSHILWPSGLSYLGGYSNGAKGNPLLPNRPPPQSFKIALHI